MSPVVTNANAVASAAVETATRGPASLGRTASDASLAAVVEPSDTARAVASWIAPSFVDATFVDAAVEAAMRWLATSGLGALALGALAIGVDRAVGARRPGLAAALWWAALVRLALPAGVGSPFGFGVPARAHDGALRVAGTHDLHGQFAAHGGAAFLLVLWGAVVLALAGLFAGRAARERRQWQRLLECASTAPRHSTLTLLEDLAARAGLARAPRCRVVDDGPVALVGLVRPTLVLPRRLDSATDARVLEAVLAHEVAHAARRDACRRVATLAACVCFWFHPAVWLGARRLAALAELDCDARAARLARGGAPACHAALVAEVRAWLAAGEHAGLVAPAFVRTRSLALVRLDALARPERTPRRGATRFAAQAAFVAASCAVAPALPPRTVVPPLASLEGCLELRHAVLAMHAQALADGRLDDLLETPDDRSQP